MSVIPAAVTITGEAVRIRRHCAEQCADAADRRSDRCRDAAATQPPRTPRRDIRASTTCSKHSLFEKLLTISSSMIDIPLSMFGLAASEAVRCKSNRGQR
jgi:hypothetical protein